MISDYSIPTEISVSQHALMIQTPDSLKPLPFAYPLYPIVSVPPSPILRLRAFAKP
jgi:hypothetical protein